MLHCSIRTASSVAPQKVGERCCPCFVAAHGAVVAVGCAGAADGALQALIAAGWVLH